MPDRQETISRRSDGVSKRALFSSSIAIVAGASIALIISMAEMLKWQEGLGLALGVAALVGGAIFTILEMRHLGDDR